jgi:hypothetical protein
MKVLKTALLLTLALFLAGCSGKSTDAPPETVPLTVEEWHKIPFEEKYEIETFERLKAGNPKLQNQRAWDQFTRSVILPSRKRDLPNQPIKR